MICAKQLVSGISIATELIRGRCSDRSNAGLSVARRGRARGIRGLRRREAAIALAATTGFGNSLQRERGSVKAFLDGWRVLDNLHIAVLDLGFAFRNVFGERSILDLKYQTVGPLLYEEVSTRDLLCCLLGRRDCGFGSTNGLRHDFLGIQHQCQCKDVEEENDDDEKEEDDDEAERHV